MDSRRIRKDLLVHQELVLKLYLHVEVAFAMGNHRDLFLQVRIHGTCWRRAMLKRTQVRDQILVHNT